VNETYVEPTEWVDLPTLAESWDLPVNRVRQLINEGALLAVRRDGALRVPAELVRGDIVRRHLPGVLTLLHDAGYTDEEVMRWLYTADDSLPGGTAAHALASGQATEVKRRAQALGF
jgi:Rv2175c C-terminal domain of unknown function